MAHPLRNLPWTTGSKPNRRRALAGYLALAATEKISVSRLLLRHTPHLLPSYPWSSLRRLIFLMIMIDASLPPGTHRIIISTVQAISEVQGRVFKQ
jgi:hypothetical protein